MTLPARTGVMLSLVLLLTTSLSAAPPDLDKHINIRLSDASLAGSVMAVSKLAGIGIVAPLEPASGLSLYLKDEPLSKVLDGLAAASGTTWSLIDELVVFTHPGEEDKPSVEKLNEVLSPEQVMAEMISSLDSVQLYRVTAGNSLSYGELNPDQQELLKNMLAPPAVGVTEGGGTIRSLPSPDQASISFITLPYLVIPNAKESMNLRLDSTAYTLLRKAAPR